MILKIYIYKYILQNLNHPPDNLTIFVLFLTHFVLLRIDRMEPG